jgi:hypothetical protein
MLLSARRAEQALDVHTAQRRNVQAMPELLGADVPDEMRCGVRVPVGVAIEAGDASAGKLRAAVLGLVELLLGKRCDEQAEPFQLLRIEDAVEELVVVHDRDELSA